MKIAAVADIHLGPHSPPALTDALHSVDAHAGVLVIAGDLTNHGTLEEISICIDVLRGVRVPIVAVLGNHDCENGREPEFVERLLDIGVHHLDGTACQLEDLGFAGVKGFCGGFTPYQLMPFGEQHIKDFVKIGQEEGKKLGDALTSLDSAYRIAVTHYAPIRATVEGEPEAIHPFLGSSHLEHAFERTLPDLAIHGHAHHGCFEGRSSRGVRVFNVAWPILRNQEGGLGVALFDSGSFEPCQISLGAFDGAQNTGAGVGIGSTDGPGSGSGGGKGTGVGSGSGLGSGPGTGRTSGSSPGDPRSVR